MNRRFFILSLIGVWAVTYQPITTRAFQRLSSTAQLDNRVPYRSFLPTYSCHIPDTHSSGWVEVSQKEYDECVEKWRTCRKAEMS